MFNAIIAAADSTNPVSITPYPNPPDFVSATNSTGISVINIECTRPTIICMVDTSKKTLDEIILADIADNPKPSPAV